MVENPNTEVVLLDGALACYLDTTTPVNELTTSTFHLVRPNVGRVLKAYDHTTMTMSVVVTGDEYRACQFLENIGGFAVFPVYSGTGDERFEGYLVIKGTDGRVLAVDGTLYLSETTMTNAQVVAGIILYLQDQVKVLTYLGDEDPAGLLATSMAEAITLVVGGGEE